MSSRTTFRNLQDRLVRIGLSIPDLLLPRQDVDLSRWAVNACDQHVHDRSYWDHAQHRIGGSPSSLSLMLPEADLYGEDVSARIRGIHRTMAEYLRSEILRPVGTGFVVVHRETSRGIRRCGLLVAFDLEAWHGTDRRRFALQPTESVVEDRIPARLSIREGAAIELPHALVLVDDPCDVLSKSLEVAPGRERYRTSLAEGAGTLRGVLIDAPTSLEVLVSSLEKVAMAGDPDEPVWFVGDGNHSLEVARRHWNRLREDLDEAGLAAHPARHLLAELVPLQSPGIEILPVHRRIHGVAKDALQEGFQDAGLMAESCDPLELRRDLQADLGRWIGGWAVDNQAWGFTSARHGPERFSEIVGEILPRFKKEFPASRVDYLHGWNEGETQGEGGCTVFVRSQTRQTLVNAFRGRKVFPPKSFSLGEPSDKRHYLEARRLCPP